MTALNSNQSVDAEANDESRWPMRDGAAMTSASRASASRHKLWMTSSQVSPRVWGWATMTFGVPLAFAWSQARMKPANFSSYPSGGVCHINSPFQLFHEIQRMGVVLSGTTSRKPEPFK